jgi:heme A synthase
VTEVTHVSTQERSRLHPFAVSAAVVCLLGILSGAAVTGSAASRGVGPGPALQQLHQIVASIAAVVIAVVGIWMVAKLPSSQAGRRLGWTLLVILLTEGGLGSFQRAPALGILHALLGQILFAMTVAAALFTSSAWNKEPDLVEDHGWPSLGSLGKITPVFVVGQIALGAAFRHQALGVLPHLVGAIVIVMLILCICIFVMHQFPEHATLRPSANLLMTLAFTQIFLGIAAFTVRTMATIAAPVVIGITSAHAAVGALVLAAAVVLQMQIRRNVRPHREQQETPNPAGG